MKTKAVSDAVEYMSLNKALQYCGVSKCAWHYTKKSKAIPIDASVTHKVWQIASRRPTYGTRRMAAQISRETGMSTNRKKIQRIYVSISLFEAIFSGFGHNPCYQHTYVKTGWIFRQTGHTPTKTALSVLNNFLSVVQPLLFLCI